MIVNNKAVLLINVGTPDAPEVSKVAFFLSEFLSDKRVIGIPAFLRFILVNFIIIPFRVRHSTELYKRLWTEKGSPLLFYGISLQNKLQSDLGNDYNVFFSARYGKPSLRKKLREIKDGNFSEIIVIPLFPQYASSTSATAIEFVLNFFKSQEMIPSIKIVNQFYNSDFFINTIVNKIGSVEIDNYDHILFTYHGLPISHIDKIHPQINCSNCNCKFELPEHGKSCYKATCYETSRLIARGLGIEDSSFTTSFQSRLSRKWLEPFTDDTILRITKKGVKKLLIVAPSFVSDCLETTIEIGEEYKKLFFEYGGEEFTLVPCLNDDDEWVSALKNIILKHDKQN